MIFLQLTPEEANNLIALINRAQITGAEALAVALLRQKVEQAIQSAVVAPPENGHQPSRAERRQRARASKETA